MVDDPPELHGGMSSRTAAPAKILGPSPDSLLGRWGLRLAASGGQNAKKRAIVAVARRLAVSPGKRPGLASVSTKLSEQMEPTP